MLLRTLVGDLEPDTVKKAENTEVGHYARDMILPEWMGQ
jgi:hypothetical protein